MKSKTYNIATIIVILFASVSTIAAQNFQIIPQGTERLIFRAIDVYSVQEVISLDTSPNHTVVNLQGKLFEENLNNLQGTDCYENEFPGSLGLSIITDQSGDQLIQLNKEGTQFARIITGAQQGDSWICTTHNGFDIIATCESVQSNTIFGITDTYKTISFSAFSCVMLLSENHGVIRSPDWSAFSRGENLLLNKCLLKEFDQVIIDKINTPFGDAAAQLTPGDILHILEGSGSLFITPNATQKKIRATFLNGTFDPINENHLLTFREEVELTEKIDNQTTTITYFDTTEHILPRYIPSGVTEEDYPLPVDKLFWIGDSGQAIRFQHVINTRLGMVQNKLSGIIGNDSINYEVCFPFLTDVGEYIMYLDGLAGPYFQSSYYPNYRELKYFKTANEEWGMPFTFTVSASEKILSKSISIFPNPVAAGSQIYLKDLGGKELLEIRLVDLHGKQVQSWQLKNTTNQESLNLQKNIPSGMYVLWITNEGQKQFYSKVLVK